MSRTTTEGIEVIVKPAYWAERSLPEVGQFAFLYAVEIANVGTQTAQLRSRHWIITDANGRVEEVRGAGVVGKQPRLEPGERFEYTSWAMLRTPFSPTTSEVRRYLREFLSDPRVIDVHPVARWLLLNGAILPIRPARSA